MIATRKVDRQRIYMMGWSNGSVSPAEAVDRDIIVPPVTHFELRSL